ncbi:MAG: hypothetical protein WB757_12430, partial [Candidatus Cybelea sp.]
MRRLSITLILCAAIAPSAVSGQTFVPKDPYATEQQPATLVLDASRAYDGIMQVRERIPAVPGPFT